MLATMSRRTRNYARDHAVSPDQVPVSSNPNLEPLARRSVTFVDEELTVVGARKTESGEFRPARTVGDRAAGPLSEVP